MNRLIKTISMAVIMIAVVSMTLVVNAYTNADVIAYIKGTHTVNGKTVRLTSDQYAATILYLEQNPVSNAEAGDMIAKAESAKKLIVDSGAKSLKELDPTIKSQAVSLVKQAGAVAGLKVEINTEQQMVTIKDPDGNNLYNGSYSELNEGSGSGSETGRKLVYTGNNYTNVIKSIIAVVAIAIVCIVGKKICKSRK